MKYLEGIHFMNKDDNIHEIEHFTIIICIVTMLCKSIGGAKHKNKFFIISRTNGQIIRILTVQLNLLRTGRQKDGQPNKTKHNF